MQCTVDMDYILDLLHFRLFVNMIKRMKESGRLSFVCIVVLSNYDTLVWQIKLLYSSFFTHSTSSHLWIMRENIIQTLRDNCT